ncbi:MAG TPA: matrixin family metalloprotease [Acidimicrobiales bacterium]|nr:matrixin family metalloprotease [Acidimicrobiales bacterium]
MPRRGVAAAVALAVGSVAGLGALAGPAGPAGPRTCPVAGHVDARVSGVEREAIPTLPARYSFWEVASDACSPVRWDPCRPVHFVVNRAGAPPGAVEDVREAFRRLAAATGMAFVDDGPTDERGGADRAPYQPGRYGRRWAPVLVEWAEPAGGTDEVQVVGTGVPTRVGDAYVTARLTLNPSAVTDAGARTPVPAGFGPATGTGPVGPRGVSWGRIVLHELGHVMGLGHTRDPAQLMYPETSEQTTRPARFADGDRAGLRHLGRPAGCLDAPRPGPAAAAVGAGRR